jgi:hypothetical protein
MTATDSYSEETWVDKHGNFHSKSKTCMGSKCKTVENVSKKDPEGKQQDISDSKENDMAAAAIASRPGAQPFLEGLGSIAHHFERMRQGLSNMEFETVIKHLYQSIGLRSPGAANALHRSTPDVLRHWNSLPWSVADNFNNDNDLVDDVLRNMDFSRASVQEGLFGDTSSKDINSMEQNMSKLANSMNVGFMEGFPNIDNFFRNVSLAGPPTRMSSHFMGGSSKGWSSEESSRSFFKDGKMHSETTQTYTGEDGSARQRVTRCDDKDCHSTDITPDTTEKTGAKARSASDFQHGKASVLLLPQGHQQRNASESHWERRD